MPALPVLALFVWLCCLLHAGAAVPPAERLLPDDTLAVLTAPDFSAVARIIGKLPEVQLWKDDALKPFRDKFLAKWREEVLRPLERELQVNFVNLTTLPRGQVTLALLQNGWQGKPDQSPAWLILVDTKDAANLATNLSALRRHRVETGKPIRTEKIRGVEFSVLSLSSNDVPKAVRDSIPHRLEYQELGVENESKETIAPSQLVIGQADTLLIAASSLRAAEQVITRLTGGSAPVLGDQAAFAANYQAFFRNAPAYAWINAKVLFDLLARQAAERKANPDLPSPPVDEISLDRALHAYGLTELRTVALSMQDSTEGLLLRAFLGAPEASRRGLLQILAGEIKECSPPPFVPANAVAFERWRLNGQKAWAALEKTLADLSPQSVSALKFVLDTAGAKAAQDQGAGYDLKKALVDNLGDDFISYEKAPRDSTPAELNSTASLYLIGSPNPAQLVAALKALFVIFPGADSATEREFLGRKIFSVPLPASLPLPLPEGARSSKPATLHYAASRDYVALSTDASLLEEYLRSGGSQGRSLRETPGLPEAAQRVTGPGAYMFGYENRAESLRPTYEAWRKSPAAGGTGAPSLPSLPRMASPERSLRDWLDFSLLPPFDKVARYFYFNVVGGSVSVEGLTYQWFFPIPPALKH